MAGKPAARLTDSTAHGGLISGPGCPTVLIGKMPAACLGDMHVCPMATPGAPPIPHVGGPISLGSTGVMIGKKPAARMGDMAVCVGPPSTVILGCTTVLIGEVGSASQAGSAGAAAAAAKASLKGPSKATAMEVVEREIETIENHSIEIEFVDSAGLPISGALFSIEGPGGYKIEGNSNAEGRFFQAGFTESGSVSCDVSESTVAQLDKIDPVENNKKKRFAPSAEQNWAVEVELVDFEGKPVPKKKYKVELADGFVREDDGSQVLDSRGYSFEGNVGEDELEFTFLDYNEGDIELLDENDEVVSEPPATEEIGGIGFKIISDTGVLLKGVAIELESLNGEYELGYTDSNGVLTFDSLKVGVYKVRYSKSHFHNQESLVTIIPNTQKSENVSLKAGNLYFAIYYVADDNAFRRAANTWKNEIKAGSGYNSSADYFHPPIQVSTEAEFLNAWKKIYDKSVELGMWVKEGNTFTHASKGSSNDGLEFQGGTLDQTDILALPKMKWRGNGKLTISACNSGLTRSGWCPASVFRDGQRVKTIGTPGYAYFSEKKDEYDRFDIFDGDKPDPIYLWAYDRSDNTSDLIGSGRRMRDVVFNR